MYHLWLLTSVQFLQIPFTSTCPVLLAGSVHARVTAKNLLCHVNGLQEVTFQKRADLETRGKRNQGKKSQFKTPGHETALQCTQCSTDTDGVAQHSAVHICSSCSFKGNPTTSSRNSGKKQERNFCKEANQKKKKALSISCPGPLHDSFHLLKISMENTWQIWWYPQGKQQNSFLLEYTFIV